jgi:hypothetical protein
MNTRAAFWLAWTTCLLSLALTALNLFLLALNWSYPNVHIVDYWLENLVATIAFATIGAVIASHYPSNPVGWIYSAIGFLGGVAHFCAEYATYTLQAAPGSLLYGEAFAWIAAWIWVPYFGLYEFSALLFPAGRLPSSRWRWFAWLSVAVIPVGTISVAFSPGAVFGLGSIQNPLGLVGPRDTVALVTTLVLSLWIVAAVSMFMRLRRATGVERLQIKWVIYTATVAIIGAFLTWVVAPWENVWWFYWVSRTTEMVGLIAIPISIGAAIFRYRLYGIDLLINRTLVYGTLTALLVGVYVGSVVLLQGLLRTLIGQESQLAIVASTLAVAALFNPLRRRIQSFIDRRFYRKKYDAAKTLEAFAAKLRDETDLDALHDDLVGVVRETMQPAHVSLWLRPDTPPKKHDVPS